MLLSIPSQSLSTLRKDILFERKRMLQKILNFQLKLTLLLLVLEVRLSISSWNLSPLRKTLLFLRK